MKSKENYGYLYETRESWQKALCQPFESREHSQDILFRAENDTDAIQAFLRKASLLTEELPATFSKLLAVKIYRIEVSEIEKWSPLNRDQASIQVFEWECDFPGNLQQTADSETAGIIKATAKEPYIKKVSMNVQNLWNPAYPQKTECECGHTYERHFDSHEEMQSVGCKYCNCLEFKPLTL